ncbi:early nodulin-like protein 3 [Lotus japonicus]|uniref:early nodulin-like protein 3 n=1 Tax=Lotus japonicus TaxID=34305 RepID=UPI002584436C|nr:early nodulin-like protein 3 [Lotus japonicus]
MAGRFLSIFLLMIPMLLLSSSQAAAREFHVGGKDGWVLKPSEDYNHWAQRNRFQVNDTLYFKYKKAIDWVLVVSKEDYDSCNTRNPIKKMDDGNSSFNLDKSGLYFFISGNTDHCKNGQKLIVLVMFMKHTTHAPPSKAPEIHSSGLNAPALSPSETSSVARFGGSVGMGLGVWIGVGVVLSVINYI